MQVSHLHKLILIENPRCANHSFADLVQAEPLTQFARFANAAELKQDGVLPTELEGYGVVVVVRNPVTRFISAVNLATSKPLELFTPQEIEDFGGDEFADLVTYLEDYETLTSATEATIEWLRDSLEWPSVFKSQLPYLEGEPDMVIGYTDLANFANANLQFNRGMASLNFVRERATQIPYIAVEFKSQIEELVADDLKLLKTYPVWSPTPKAIRTAVGGSCGGCGSKPVAVPPDIAAPLEVAFPKDQVAIAEPTEYVAPEDTEPTTDVVVTDQLLD